MPAKSPRSGTPPTPMSSYSIGLPREAQDSLTLRNCGECPPPMSMQQGWGWVETTGDWAAETDLLKLELWAELKSQQLPQTNQQRQETSFDSINSCVSTGSKILNPATWAYQWVCCLQERQPVLGGTTTLTSLGSDTGQPLGLDQDQLHGPDQSQPSVPDQDLPPGPAQDQALGPDQTPEPEQAPAKQKRTQAVAKDLGIPRDKAICFLDMSTCGRDNNLNFIEFRGLID